MDEATWSIEAARRSVETARKRLLHPTLEALGHCLGDIESAIRSMRRVEAALQSQPETRKAVPRSTGVKLQRLRRELDQVNALMQNAAQFYSGWAALVLPQEDTAASYTPSGASAASVEKRLVLHG